jgi:hypothetical protein
MWTALVAAILNVLVVVLGINLAIDQLAALNIAAAAIIGIVANESAKGTVGTFAATTTPAAKDT